MGVLAYRSNVSEPDLNQLIAELLPDNVEGFFALLLREDRYSLTRHVPAASFSKWERGIIFSEKQHLEWRRLTGGYRLLFITDKNVTDLDSEYLTIRDLTPLNESRSIMLGSLVADTPAFWHSASASKPLDYPVPGKGLRVTITTKTYGLPDNTKVTRFKGVSEC